MFKYLKVTFFFAAVLFLFANSASAQTIIYVSNLTFNTTEATVRREFEEFGEVSSVRMLSARGTAFVYMTNPKEAERAIRVLHGSNVDGRPIRVNLANPRPVKPTEKPKEMQTTPKTEPKKPDQPKETVKPEEEPEKVRLYIGNLSLETTEESLEETFEEQGEVISVSIEKDAKGRSKGFGYIEMSAEDAENAVSTLNGSELDGKKIVVKKVEPIKKN